MSRSLVKDSVVLREEILKRIEELDLSFTNVCKDAQQKGYKLSISALSRYFSNSDKNKLSEEDIIWLSYRYCIYTYLSIGIPQILENKMRWIIPPYNEGNALKMLKIAFPETKIKSISKKKKAIKV